MKNKNIVIREAVPEDAELVQSFIIELATYERLLGETKTSVDALHRDLQKDANPRLYALIAEVEGTAVGMAAYYLSYSTNRTSWGIHLQDFFIRESYRGQGIGEALFKHLAQQAIADGREWIELDVLLWNHDARGFYERMGGIVNAETERMYFKNDSLMKLARSKV